MREIKFRAWTGKQMLNRELCDRNWYNDKDQAVKTAMPEDKGRLKIMQFTGLKDKNGVEIYEGDIVKTTRKLRSGITKYEVPLRIVEWVESKSYIGFNIGVGTPEYNKTSVRQLEVVGNIYLLKESK